MHLDYSVIVIPCYLLVISLIPHKESWFLVALVPLMCILASFSIKMVMWEKVIAKIFMIVLVLGNSFWLMESFNHGKGYWTNDAIMK